VFDSPDAEERAATRSEDAIEFGEERRPPLGRREVMEHGHTERGVGDARRDREAGAVATDHGRLGMLRAGDGEQCPGEVDADDAPEPSEQQRDVAPVATAHVEGEVAVRHVRDEGFGLRPRVLARPREVGGNLVEHPSNPTLFVAHASRAAVSMASMPNCRTSASTSASRRRSRSYHAHAAGPGSPGAGSIVREPTVA